MSRLVFVRHGKASAFSRDDYDKLSEPGMEQARRLGAYWAEQRATFDRVYVGPRVRQRETHAIVADAMRASGVVWPAPIELVELDEHQGIQLVFAAIPKIAHDDPALASFAAAFARGETPKPSEMLWVFRALTRRWARGELNEDGIETFRDFRRRVDAAIDRMTSETGRGKSCVAFTSAGAIAAAVGSALDLDDPKVLDLSWSLHNASLSELASSDERLGLVTFNGTPHLRDASLVTSV